VCLVAHKTYKPLGLYAYKAMTYFKDEEMLILKYCSAACDSKGWYACASSRRQRGRVVSASEWQSGGPGFESRSNHYLALFHGSPA